MGLFLTACVAPTTPPPAQSVAATNADDSVAMAAVETTDISDPIVTAQFARGGGNLCAVGSLLFRYTAIERNGEIYICGAFTGRGGPLIRKVSRAVMQQARVTANGETLLRTAGFFTEASNRNFSSQLVGVETNCRSTGQPAGAFPLASVRVEPRDGQYKVER